MNAVMNLWVRWNAKVSGLTEDLLSSHEKLCSLEYLVSYMVGWMVGWFSVKNYKANISSTDF